MGPLGGPGSEGGGGALRARSGPGSVLSSIPEG